jgi:hypothetical protein
MANETEPRALSAALAAPAFVTRNHGAAMHAADRHVERWAPEATAKRVRSMHALGFVDRLVAPWIETAQRSASLRMFQQYAAGPAERPAASVSWVFPRPWYQDEIDWMAAARHSGAHAGRSPSLLTTRGTYVAPSSSSAASAPVAAPPMAMPAALYEYVAPSLSLAASRPAPIAGVGFGGDAVPRGEAYSPLVSLAAVHAAELMTRTIAPLVAPRGVTAGLTGADAGVAGRAAMTPGLRSVLTSILARAAASQDMPPTRLAVMAPELVTPPAPRGDTPVDPAARPSPGVRLPRGADEPEAASALQVAEQYAAQQQRVAELQRVAQQVAQREAAARAELARSQSAAAAAADARAVAQARDAVAARDAAAARAATQASDAAAAQARGEAAARAATQASEAAAAQARGEAVARAATQASEAAAAQARGEAAARAAAQANEAAAAQARDAAAAHTAQAAAAQPAPGAEAAELRAAAERAEAELRQQAAGRGEAQRAAATAATPDASRAGVAPAQVAAAGRGEAQRQAEAASAAAAAERARIEERVAQRLTERSAAQRLHEQARVEAAAHARAEVEQASRAAAAGPAGAPGFAGPGDVSSAPAPVAAPVTPAEVTAAIAALPPDLAAILSSVVAQRPDRAMQAIHEINQALRTVELLARSSAAGAAFEPIRGPRLVMPAGLGGLVSAVDRAHAIAERPALLGGQRPLAPLSLPERVAPEAGAARAVAAPAREVRVPTLTWLSVDPRPQPIASTTALGATAAAAPSALSHVAWADRWLARFAGAAPQSLEMITAAGAADPTVRMRALASAAPDAVFVAPDFLRGDAAADLPQGRLVRPGAAPVAAAVAAAAPPAPSGRAASTVVETAAPRPAPTGVETAAPRPATTVVETAAPRSATTVVETAAPRPAPPAEILRFDDAGETPDDVFAAIAAAASRGRAAAARPSAPAAAVAPAAPSSAPAPVIAAPADRPVLADLVAHAAPSAPGAGLSAQLAASPFAAALRHVLTLPSAPSFDVRSLFGADLGLTYLAGLIGPASRELEIGAQSTPVWASWAEAALPLAAAADRPDRIDRLVPGFDAAYVHPEAPARDADPLAAARLTGGAGVPSWVGAAAAPSAAAPSTAAPSAAAPSAAAPSAAAPSAAAAAAPSAAAAASMAAAAPTAAAALPPADRLTTLRTALLSWEVAVTGEPGAPGALQLVPAAFATAPALVSATAASYRDAAAASAGAARRMVESLSLPMVGESALERPATWAAPGMLAERAHSWSVAEERSASDLALDFVTPELVLAARVYGLGPAEAAQAARLAIAGPGYLGAMASMVDRTFVEALAIGRDARLDAERQPRRAIERGEPAGAPPGIDGGAVRDARGVPGGLPVVAPAPFPAAGTPAELTAPAAAAAAAAATAPRATITTAFPTPGGEIAAAIAPIAGSALAPSGTAFGVDRRAPRGAFLWPSATVAALGMNAAAPDGQLSMSVAALELLAAQVVAELGTYTALSDAHAATLGIAGEGEATAAGRGALRTGAAARELLAPSATSASGEPAARAAQATDAGRSPAALTGRRDAAPAGAEPGESEVLGAAAALIPASRRARFEALYVALGQSPAGIHWSPATRAARALALAGRGEDRPVTARERAAAAWEVLPVVFGGDLGDAATAGASTPAAADAAVGGIAAASASAAIAQAMANHVAPTWLSGPRPPATTGARGARTRPGAGPGDREVVAPDFGGAADLAQVHVTGPGLSGLASRAGEALGSYIMPASPPAAPRERSSDLTSVGAMLRPPTAAPEYVQTGRSAGRYGGGEVEIPPWFEAAARKMLTERSSGDGISFAELTLVTAAPSSHIAASTRSAPSAVPATPSPATAAQQAHSAAPQIDVEKLANEVYRNILVLMDVARARNGDPYL